MLKNKTKVLIKYLENPDKFGPWAPKTFYFMDFQVLVKQCL